MKKLLLSLALIGCSFMFSTTGNAKPATVANVDCDAVAEAVYYHLLHLGSSHANSAYSEALSACAFAGGSASTHTTIKHEGS